MKIDFVDYSPVFLKMSWTWLNDPDIKFMTNTPDFSIEGQQKWFSSLPDRKDYMIWGITANDQPIGVCGLKDITEQTAECWGYIGEKDYQGKKIGVLAMQKFVEIAENLHLSSLYVKVIEENARALRLFDKMGFVYETRQDDLIIRRLDQSLFPHIAGLQL
jgi:RimJ/RimL family protein N-acetyltransferase